MFVLEVLFSKGRNLHRRLEKENRSLGSALLFLPFFTSLWPLLYEHWPLIGLLYVILLYIKVEPANKRDKRDNRHHHHPHKELKDDVFFMVDWWQFMIMQWWKRRDIHSKGGLKQELWCSVIILLAWGKTSRIIAFYVFCESQYFCLARSNPIWEDTQKNR